MTPQRHGRVIGAVAERHRVSAAIVRPACRALVHRPFAHRALGKQREADVAPDLIALEHAGTLQEVDRVVVSDDQRLLVGSALCRRPSSAPTLDAPCHGRPASVEYSQPYDASLEILCCSLP